MKGAGILFVPVDFGQLFHWLNRKTMIDTMWLLECGCAVVTHSKVFVDLAIRKSKWKISRLVYIYNEGMLIPNT